MQPYRITRLTFSDGTEMPLAPRTIVVIVGPNNSGKSRALRDIEIGVRNREDPRIVIPDLADEKTVDGSGFRHWIEAHAHVFRLNFQDVAKRPNTEAIALGELESRWTNESQLRNLTPFLVLQGTTENRLGLASSVGVFNSLDDRPSNPLQELYLNVELEKQISAASLEAFRKPLTVNRAAGNEIHLQVGELGDIPGPWDVTNSAYLEALRKLPKIQEEGDGVRSYIGILLSSIAAEYPLVLLDEPEAFLHPPQASQLGRELVKLLPEDGGQVFVSSHSADFLQGVLHDRSAPVTVVRLTRDGDINKAAILGADELGTLWGDPILRYSSLLDGLFHRGVVLCEGDSDCRFYQATLDETLAREGQPAHDLLFTHTGGKHRLPTAISALRAVRVDVQVIADFDVLADQALLRRIIEKLDGDWELFVGDWGVVNADVGNLREAPLRTVVKGEIEKVLGEIEGDRLTAADAEKLRSLAKVDSGWSQVKEGGLVRVPSGNATAAAERLVANLANIGLHVVPVGELEYWSSDLPGKSTKWVAAALEARIHEKPGPHVDFIKAVAGSVGA
jgi:hypothetical protein